MSPTRKPKPPDKGAPPEHKPSRKVALEEVMRSLQDLVSNELATEPAKPSSKTATTAANPKKTGPAEKQAVARPAFSADALPVVAQPPAEPESITPDHAFPTQSASTTPDIIDELPDLGAEPLTTAASPPATAGSAVPAEGLQQELPYLEDISPAPSAIPPAPIPEAAAFEMAELSLQELARAELPLIEVKTDIIAEHGTLPPEPMTTALSASGEEINWDDIPILEEVVDMSEELDVHETGHAADQPVATKLPTADAARRLAIQVAARLNVELRKSGQGGLSSDIITRLARLLQEALAKGAPNMENTPVNKASFTDGGSAGREAVPTGTNAGAVFRPPPDKH